MIARFAVAATLALMSAPALAAICNLTDFEANVISCKNSCDSSGHQPECNGSGTMGTTSGSNDADGVIRGFEVCHPDRTGKDQTKDEIAEACLNSNRQDVLNIVRRIYGHAPPPPPPPPQPTVKGTDFNLLMHFANDNKQAIIADFDIAGNGSFQQITVKYHRDDKDYTLINTYAVGAIYDNGKFHVKVTAYDYTVADASKHKYEVAGTVYILTPP